MQFLLSKIKFSRFAQRSSLKEFVLGTRIQDIRIEGIYIEIRFSCAYWLLSVICLLDSQLSKCCVSHRQQISSLSNRMIAPITCHQENSSITTLRASFPTMSLFFLTFHLLLVDSCSTASQAMLGAKVLVLVCGVIA